MKCPNCENPCQKVGGIEFCPVCGQTVRACKDEITASPAVHAVTPLKPALEDVPENPFAYPQPIIDNQGRIDTACEYGHGGMTLRDYFAGQALSGMMANHALIDNFSAHESMTKESFVLADSMLRARKGGA